MTVIDSSVTSEEQRVLDLVEDLLEKFPPKETDSVTFLGEQFDRGLAWVHFDEGLGGLGLNAKLQALINQRVFAAGGPNVAYRNPIGYGMCGPTVHACGSEEQTERYLRPLLRCDEIWCQLFSEPNAGSDLTGLRCRAERDGDAFVVNGQKVWTSYAQFADWGVLLARTDADAAKAKGISFLIVDMRSPGITVRPLRQMTGSEEFNEVFFTDTLIPANEMLGKPGDGWRVSLTTLMNERVSIGGAIPQKGSGVIGSLVKTWQELPKSARTPPRVTRSCSCGSVRNYSG